MRKSWLDHPIPSAILTILVLVVVVIWCVYWVLTTDIENLYKKNRYHTAGFNGVRK